ncbi:MAG: RES family NAD+ phosphorylase [Steroidobacteraceae bacterium]
MARFPNSPGAALLAGIEPSLCTVAAGTALVRVYRTSSGRSLWWNEFCGFGPLNCRWTHHLPTAAGGPVEQTRGIYYAAADAQTCLAEVFQATRRIDRVYQAPWLVVFKTLVPLVLLDLTGDFAARMGASMAIHSGSRQRARGWARDLYAAFPQAQGIVYASVAHGGAPALALNERALRVALFPPHPEFHRALADDVLLDPLKHAAQALGYALR